MREGKLPAWYLGAPLVSTRLSSADCAALVEKIIGRIDPWIAKKLSFADHIHLLTSILYKFIQYLFDDFGPFLLPVSIYNDDALSNRIHNPKEEEDYQVSEGFEDELEQSSRPPSFPELKLKIKESIKSLGGAIFPKLNWSAPKDSTWISTIGSRRCATFSEIAHLLRSFESLIHDLCHAYDSYNQDHIISFLCSASGTHLFFVRGQNLFGISQHEVTTFYPILLEKIIDLERLVQQFYEHDVRLKFESENYTFDVYVTKFTGDFINTHFHGQTILIIRVLCFVCCRSKYRILHLQS
jgi:hypothetical protein